MPQLESKLAITRDRYDAVLLDLDGVITNTASIHASCWKQMLDEYLQKRAAQRGEAFRSFDIATAPWRRSSSAFPLRATPITSPKLPARPASTPERASSMNNRPRRLDPE
jgi:hypothetical protein